MRIMISRLIFSAALALLAAGGCFDGRSAAWGQAGCGPGVPCLGPAGTQQITPQGGSGSQTLNFYEGLTALRVPPGGIQAWHPVGYGSTRSTDSGGLLTSRTSIVIGEVPFRFLAMRVGFFNLTNAAFPITNCGVTGSSQFGGAGVGTNNPVTPWNASGVALTGIMPCSFGNAGADVPPNQYWTASNPPANALVLISTGATTSGSKTATFSTADSMLVTVGQVAVVLDPPNCNYSPQFVSSVNTGTGVVTFSDTANVGCSTGTAYYFLAPGITVPAPTTATYSGGQTTNPARVWSDWLYAPSYARIDSPTTSATTLIVDGLSDNPTISAVTSTQVSFGTGLTAAVPMGTGVRFCRATTTSGTITPNFVIPFAAPVANVAAGWMAIVGQAFTSWPTTLTPGFFFTSPVASNDGGGNITLTNPIAPFMAGGSETWTTPSVTFYTTTTGVGTSASGQKVITVASTTGFVADGSQRAYGTGIPTGSGAVITAVNPGVSITITNNLTANIVAGEPVNVMQGATANNVTGRGSVTTILTTNILTGYSIIGTGWPSIASGGSVIQRTSGGSQFVSQSPFSTINSGSAVQVCSTALKTSAYAGAGATALSFDTTNFPEYLFQVRVNVGAGALTNVVSWGDFYGGAWANQTGFGQIAAYRSNSSTFCVVVPTNCGDATGMAGTIGSIPFDVVEFLTEDFSVLAVITGDSTMQGNGNISDNSYNLCAVWAALASRPALPVSCMNLAYGGQASNLYFPLTQQFASLQPSVWMAQGIALNDNNNSSNSTNVDGGYQMGLGQAAAFVGQARNARAFPVLITSPARQCYGTSSAATTAETNRETGNASLLALAATGTLVLDFSALLADPANSNFSLQSLVTGDCVHPNMSGHKLGGGTPGGTTGLFTALQPYVRY